MSILLPPLITPRMSEMTYVSMVADLNLNLCKDADLKTQFSLIYLDYFLWGLG